MAKILKLEHISVTEKNVVSQSYVREVAGPDRLRDRSKHSQTELAHVRMECHESVITCGAN